MKKRKLLISLPIPLPVEDIVPLVDDTHTSKKKVRDADDKQVIQDEDSEFPRVVQALEEDSELKRGCRDDVPIQIKRIWGKKKGHSRTFETTLEQQNTNRIGQ